MSKVNYANWEARFGTQVKERLSVCGLIIDEAADELKSRYEKRTPIGDPSLWNWPAPPGYVPGTLKASWEITRVGSVLRNNRHITIYNPQPYAVRVETGWSTQAPNGMMRVSNKEWSSIVDSINRKYK